MTDQVGDSFALIQLDLHVHDAIVHGGSRVQIDNARLADARPLPNDLARQCVVAR